MSARRRLVVSLDGPGSSGKSSIGSRAAERIGYRFCDTGVLYRGLALAAVRKGIDPADAAALADLAPLLRLVTDGRERYVRLVVDGIELTDQLHSAEVDRTVSQVSALAPVRAALLPVQRGLADGGGIIMAGRDIGSIVLPDADLKLYLQVSVEERARRRANQRRITDPAARKQIEDELRERDRVDSTRAVAPLRIPDGAVVLNTDDNTLKQSVEMVVRLIEDAARGA